MLAHLEERNNNLIQVQEEDIIVSILNGEIHTPQELADKFKLTLFNASKILNSPTFLQTLNNYSQGLANLHFHQKDLNRLLTIAESEDDKNAMTAIKLIANYTNNVKGNNTDVNVNLNLADLIDRMDKKEKNITPEVIIPLEIQEGLK